VTVLEVPRDEMDRRIDARVARMIEGGLVDEVRGLLAGGVSAEAPGMTGTGYREVAEHLATGVPLDETVRRIAQNTRRYSRRQVTWFRNQLRPEWRSVDATAPLERQVAEVLDVWTAARPRHRGVRDDARETGR